MFKKQKDAKHLGFPKLELPVDTSRPEVLNANDIRQVVDSYNKFAQEAGEAYKTLIKEYDVATNRNVEKESRIGILEETLSQTVADNQRFYALGEVHETVDKFVMAICKHWFGEPITIDNWLKKNIDLFDVIKGRLGGLEEKVSKAMAAPDATPEERAGLKDKDKRFDKKIVSVTAEKFAELTRDAGMLRVRIKENLEREKQLGKKAEKFEEETNNLKELLSHLEIKHADLQRQFDITKKNLVDMEKNQVLAIEQATQAHSQFAARSQTTELEKKVGQQEIELQQLRSNLALLAEQNKKLKSQTSEETTKLENAYKQEQIAHEQLKKDLQALEDKEKETDSFLMKEAKKSKKLNEELAHARDRHRETEEELRRTVELLKSSHS